MMKKKFMTFVFAFFGLTTAYSQIGIGTPTPDASAILHLQNNAGSSKGLIFPRINGTTTFISPISGIVFYDTSANCLKVSRGSWYSLCDGSSTALTTGSVPASTGVCIGCSSSDGNAILDIVSNTKGVLLPIATSDPIGASGMIYYNSTTNVVKLHNGSTWLTLNKY